MFLLGTGMVLYSTIVSPGLFCPIRSGQWFGMFGALLVLAYYSITKVWNLGKK